MADRKKLVALTSPKMTFRYPALVKPEFGSKEFPKPDGEYKLEGLLDADSPEARTFIARLQPHFDAAVDAGKEAYAALKAESRKKLEKQGGFKVNEFYTALLDKETEEETGEISFKFGMAASGEYKKGPKEGQRWARRPALFDAGGNPIIVTDRKGNVLSHAVEPWSGTVGKVNFEISPYFIAGTGVAGMKLALVGVQIIEMQTGGQRSAKSMGFEAEDGYTADNRPPADDEDDDASEGADAGGTSPNDDF